jgi:succinate-semialdehyde dehydrogenase/glutarate-semialdehyde dehydrogenase
VGNTVVFKHSEECPLISKLFETVMLQLKDLPAGVFSTVYGGPEVGDALIQQNIDMIWFTGSSATGKKIYEIAGKKQIKAILEMGGSNPAIIFEDADLDNAAEKISQARFLNCGQVCDAIKRVIVHHSCYQPLVKKLVTIVKNLKLGDPEMESTQLGPLAAMRQLELLETQVNDSIRDGAHVVIGGKRPDNLSGAYYLPTILTNIHPQMRVWREEIFGPVLPIVPFDTEDQAIHLANDTPYGLGAVILSKDLERAQRVATQIDAGCIDINEGSHWLPCNPFGGFKASGMACEHGRLGFQELCRFKVIAEAANT